MVVKTESSDLDVHNARWSDRGSIELVHGLWRRTGASKLAVSGRSLVLHVKVERHGGFENFARDSENVGERFEKLRESGESSCCMTVGVGRRMRGNCASGGDLWSPLARSCFS